MIISPRLNSFSTKLSRSIVCSSFSSNWNISIELMMRFLKLVFASSDRSPTMSIKSSRPSRIVTTLASARIDAARFSFSPLRADSPMTAPAFIRATSSPSPWPVRDRHALTSPSFRKKTSSAGSPCFMRYSPCLKVASSRMVPMASRCSFVSTDSISIDDKNLLCSPISVWLRRTTISRNARRSSAQRLPADLQVMVAARGASYMRARSPKKAPAS
mmetsp:Transcript_52345/g.137720  ORF Transcript_52345/g.137720 Transcript_52345/m.137720 type:complete len:216 (-) Transcript_52345:9-656(-)